MIFSYTSARVGGDSFAARAVTTVTTLSRTDFPFLVCPSSTDFRISLSVDEQSQDFVFEV